MRPITLLISAALLSGSLLAAAPALAQGNPTALFEEVYQDLSQSYVQPLDPQDLVQSAIQGMVQSLGDPYTEYFSPQDLSGFQDALAGRYVGLGLQLKSLGDDLAVTGVFAGSPADAAGLQSGDRIVTIDGKSVKDLGADQAVAALKGLQGDVRRLSVERDGKSLDFAMTLAPVQIPDFTGRLLPDGMVYLKIAGINDGAATDLDNYLSSLSKNPVGYILDLRDNPGGDVNAAAQIIQEFLAQGKVADFANSQDQESLVIDGGTNRRPVAVLMNGETASAAEIIAAALHDQDGATLVGQTSFGKGVAQQVIPLSNGGALKVTIARWYGPNGESVQGKGLVPDEVYSDSSSSLWAADHLLGGGATESLRLAVGHDEAWADNQGVALDQAPILYNGSVYITTDTAESLLGAQVDTSDAGVTLSFGTATLRFPTAGGAELNGQKRPDFPAILSQGGNTWLPLRAVAQALGYGIGWEASTIRLQR